MDLWSNNPLERLAAARDSEIVANWPQRIGNTAPMKPWPYGMPCSINPFVVFLGKSPGNSPAAGDADYLVRPPYALPTAGVRHPKLDCSDARGYWVRVRELGSVIVKRYAPAMSEQDAHALIGQLNLGTGAFGQAKEAPLEKDYCRWVPDVLMDYLKPCYLILVGLNGLKKSNGEFDPCNRLRIDWNRPEVEFPFVAYTPSQYRFRLWKRKRSDGRTMNIVMWPQHPCRAPMTNSRTWQESGREFIRHPWAGIR